MNNEKRILEIKQQYIFISDEEIENLDLDIYKNIINEENDEAEEFINNQVPNYQIVDIFEQTKKNINKKTTIVDRISVPPKFEKENSMKMMLELNERQRMIIMHIYKCFKEESSLPLNIFIHGSAGVGKSKVI